MQHAISARAPRPQRSSFARSLYDALDSLAGPATLQQVIEMIPATDDAHKWDTAKPKRVLQLLIVNKNGGYVMEAQNNRWQIATLPYFEAQQQHRSDVREGKVRKRPQGTKFSLQEVTKYVHVERWEGVALLLMGLLIGFAFGVYT